MYLMQTSTFVFWDHVILQTMYLASWQKIYKNLWGACIFSCCIQRYYDPVKRLKTNLLTRICNKKTMLFFTWLVFLVSEILVKKNNSIGSSYCCTNMLVSWRTRKYVLTIWKYHNIFKDQKYNWQSVILVQVSANLKSKLRQTWNITYISRQEKLFCDL